MNTQKLVPYQIIGGKGNELWLVKDFPVPGQNIALYKAVGRVDFDHIECKNGAKWFWIMKFCSDNPPEKCYFRVAQDKPDAQPEPVHTDAKECRWKQDDSGDWFTRCGEAWSFTDGGVAENRIKFCPYCGKTICAVIYSEQDEPLSPIPEPTPEQLAAIGKVLDGDAPRVCEDGDIIWRDDRNDFGIATSMNKYVGKLCWHLKDAPAQPEPVEHRSCEGCESNDPKSKRPCGVCFNAFLGPVRQNWTPAPPISPAPGKPCTGFVASWA